MAPEPAPPTSRRALRSPSIDEPADDVESPSAGTLTVDQPALDDIVLDPLTTLPTSHLEPLALAWVDEDTVAPAPPVEPIGAPDLLAGVKRRSPWRPGVLVPTGVLTSVAAVYSATTLLWPLHAIAPVVDPVTVQPVAAAVAAPAWPGEGSAAISVAGVGTLASAPEVSSIASITKVVTALVVLDEMPLAVGESGPEYAFTAADRNQYRQYRANGESALDVPVGGTLTQYQLLEGLLIGSANNYADRLARDLWPSHAVYADAATRWLDLHGVPGVSIVDPSGIGSGNAASAEALVPLATRALENPVVAEIVAKAAIDLPGAGRVVNTNSLLADPGVVGVKTGTLDAYNLLTAKDVLVGDTSVRLYASVLGQPSDEARDAVSRELFARLELELQPQPSVTAGTLAGRVVTRWGESVDVRTVGDADLVLWNGGVGAASTEFSLGDADEAGETVGTLTLVGPLDTETVDLRLDGDLEQPTAWWRLTHPLDVFGLNG